MFSLAAVRARYEADKLGARRQAVANLNGQINMDFDLSPWGERARQCFIDQWKKGHQPMFEWEEVFRRHNDPDRLDIAIWGPSGRLCGLSLGLTTSEAVEIRFLEGDPRPGCPLKGRRILIVLECAACYAQARGRKELRIQPINEDLEDLYRQVYGFVLETSHGGDRYYRRGVGP